MKRASSSSKINSGQKCEVSVNLKKAKKKEKKHNVTLDNIWLFFLSPTFPEKNI